MFQTAQQNATLVTRLELKKEDGVYAYESDDGVSWALVASAALVFSGPVNAGVSACTPGGTTQAQLEQVSVTRQSQALTEAPFTIDTDEIVGGAEVTAYIMQEGLSLGGSASGTLSLLPPVTADGPPLIVTLRETDGTPVAFDVLIYGVKESLTFDATNAAKAHVMFLLNAYNISTDRRITGYSKIEKHPNFPRLVEFIRTHKGYPDDDALFEIMADISHPIVADLATELRNPQEPIGSLTPQTVRSGHGFPRTSTFRLTQPEDSNSVIVEVSSMLDFRLG